MSRSFITLILGVLFGAPGMAADMSARKTALASLAEKLSRRDLSVLREGLKAPENQMMTTEGSRNDVLWSALERMGLMNQIPLPEAMAEAIGKIGVKTKVFVVTRKVSLRSLGLIDGLQPS